jgi:dTDP-4-dehydrorhamnose 3,5-epimerase
VSCAFLRRFQRGYFEAFNQEKFHQNRHTILSFKTINLFTKGTQRVALSKPFAQAKLRTVLQGEILDVAPIYVKIRPPWEAFFLFCYRLRIKTGARSTRICPWFSVLSETAVVLYKCDQYYNKESEGGIHFDDPT